MVLSTTESPNTGKNRRVKRTSSSRVRYSRRLREEEESHPELTPKNNIMSYD